MVTNVHSSVSPSTVSAVLNFAQNCQWWHRWHYWSHLRVSSGPCQDEVTESEDRTRRGEDVQWDAGLLQEDAQDRRLLWNVQRERCQHSPDHS